MISSRSKALIINCIPRTWNSPPVISLLNSIHKFHLLKTQLIISFESFLSQPALPGSSFSGNAARLTLFHPALARIPGLSLTLFFTSSPIYLQVLLILSPWYFSSLSDLTFFKALTISCLDSCNFPCPQFFFCTATRVFLYKCYAVIEDWGNSSHMGQGWTWNNSLYTFLLVFFFENVNVLCNYYI